MNYYNENDPYAAQWLRNLIHEGLIPDGYVDERSIVDVKAEQIIEFNQCHFFAGIGGWAYALQLAGIQEGTKLWTGSCPCQPFSAAGKHKGQADERHLWPEMFRLIRECKPPIVFGEQVASAIGHGWLDGISDDLEAENYAVGSAVLPACSVGAPHIRQRLFWVADSRHESAWRPARSAETESGRAFGITSGHGEQRLGGLEHAESEQVGFPGRPWFERDTALERMVYTDGAGREQGESSSEATRHRNTTESASCWSDFDIAQCADGKARRIEPCSQPLVNGVPFRLADGRTLKGASRKEVLKGIGNAIVPQVAAEFIKAFMQ